MILLDTSVVIDYSRGKDLKLLTELPKHPAAVCSVVHAELLGGARGKKHRADLLTLLATFSQLQTPEFIWDLVGDNSAALRAAGLTVPLPDVTIATLGIENDLEVWSRDPHFPAMQKVLTRLRLFQEP